MMGERPVLGSSIRQSSFLEDTSKFGTGSLNMEKKTPLDGSIMQEHSNNSGTGFMDLMMMNTSKLEPESQSQVTNNISNLGSRSPVPMDDKDFTLKYLQMQSP